MADEKRRLRELMEEAVQELERDELDPERDFSWKRTDEESEYKDTDNE